MPASTTVLEHRTAAKAAADAAVTALQSKLVQLSTAVSATQAEVAAAVARLAQDQQADAQLHASLAQVTLASDATSMAAQLADNWNTTRVDQAALGAATDAASSATRSQAAATAALAQAQVIQAQAAADLAAAEAADTLTAQWTTVAEAPVTTAALAAAAGGPALVAAAVGPLETIIGVGMMALFRHRQADFDAAQQAWVDRVISADSALAALITTEQPLVGAVNSTEGVYLADRLALAELAQDAVSDITLAVACLTAAAQVGAIPANEQAQLTAVTAAALTEVDHEADAFSKATTVRAEAKHVDEETLLAIENDPDTDPNTIDHSALTTDQAALVTAQQAVVSSAISAWEALIPAAVLDLAVASARAESTLARWGAVTAADVVDALTTAEQNYAEALDAELAYERSLTILQAELDGRQADQAAADQVAQLREAAAVRGAS